MSGTKKEPLWNYSLEDIAKGYVEETECYCCLFCKKKYQKGRIYQISYRNGEKEMLYDAYGAVCVHIQNEHGGTADYLLWQKPTQVTALTGISETQRKVLQLMSEGKNDREIGTTMGIAESTVRNHRFRLREREKQAKLFLAMMKSLEEKTKTSIAMSDKGTIEELSFSAAMVDERYGITEQERDKTLKAYFKENGALRQFPAKEKKKIIVLGKIIKCFKPGTIYSEPEVNRILERIYEADHPTIRRALIEYGFMERSTDCRVYRVKE